MSTSDDNRDVKRRKTETGKVATEKDVVIPTEDLDDLIGDMIKEELQLLITRMVKKNPAFVEDLKPQIIRIIKSRARQTPPPQLSAQQLRQLGSSQQLFQATQSLGTQLGLTQQDLFGGFAFSGPINAPTQQLPFAMNTQGGSLDLPDIDKYGVDVAAIRRAVRDAFVQTNRDSRKRKPNEPFKAQYRVNAIIITEEIKKGKEAILKNNEIRKGLSIFEAVTSEYVNRGTELGEQNISGYNETLEQIAKDWTEIFLHESMSELSDEERTEWDGKLFKWDNSASEEEGTFASARAAARLGWKDVQLQQVLKGEHIGKFKEPKELSIVRLNQLEREKKFTEAYNLAKAVDLDFYASKFLIKLDKLKEAEELALSMEEPEKIFQIAKVARSQDVNIAFNLAIKSIAVTHEWNSDNQERSEYLVELSIANHLMDKLVEKVTDIVKHKTVQYNIAKILKEREQFTAALEISKLCLKPHVPTEEELKKLEEEREKVKNGQIQVLPDVDPGTIVPRGLTTWIWLLTYDMFNLELINERSMKEELDYILNTETEIDELVDLIDKMKWKQEYELVLIVGSKCFEKIAQMRAKEFDEQQKLIKEIIENPDYLEQNPTAATVSLNYNPRWDNLVYSTAQNMINAALDSRMEKPKILTRVKTQNTPPKIREVPPISNEKLIEVLEECLDNITDVDKIVQFGNVLRGRNAYDLILRTANKIFDKIGELKIEKKEHDAKMNELQALRNEEQELLQKKNKKLKSSQLNRMKELMYHEKLFNLLPPSRNYGEAQFDNINLQAAQLALNAALDSLLSTKEEERMSRSAIEKVVDDAIGHVNNPNHLLTLMNQLMNKQEYHLLVKVGYKGQQVVESMAKRHEERQKIQIPLNLLLEEEEALIRNRKQLSADQAKELKRLQSELEKLPQPYYYDPQNVDSYESTQYQFANQMIKAAFASKNVEQQFHRGFGFSQLPKIERKPIPDDKIEEIVDKCLKYVRHPNNLYNLTTLINHNEYKFALKIGRDMLKQVVHLIEDKEKRELPRLQAIQLRQEQQRLMDIKKWLPKADQQRLREFTLQERMWKLLPSFYSKDAAFFDRQIYNISCQLINQFINRRNEFKTKLNELIQKELATKDEEDVEMKDDADEEEDIQKKLDENEELLSDLVHELLEYIKNPNDLKTIAKHLKNNKEFKLVIKVGKHLQQRLIEIKKERDEREKVLEELEELEKEEESNKSVKNIKKKAKDPQKVQRIKELEIQRDMFKILPNYTTFDDAKLDQIMTSCIETMINACYDAKEEDERRFEIERVPEKEKYKILKGHDETIVDIVNLSLTFIDNPQKMSQIVSLLKSKRNYSLMYNVGQKCLERIEECIKMRKERDLISVQIEMLLKEEDQLQLLRKQLEPEQQEKLDELQDKLINLELPYYIENGNLDNFNMWKQNYIWDMLNAVLRQRQWLEDQINEAKAGEAPYLVKKYEKELDKIQKLIDDISELAMNHIENPDSLQFLTQSIYNYKNYTLTIKIGKKCMEIIKILRDEANKRQRPTQQYLELSAEHDHLLQKRKELPKQTRELLRELELQYKLQELAPSFCKYTSNELDCIAYKTAQTMIDAALDASEVLQTKVELDSQMEETQIEEEAKAIAHQLDEVIEYTLDTVITVENLMNLVQELSNRLEYGLVLVVGLKCQERIKTLKEQIKRIHALNEEKAKLTQQNKIKPSKDKQQRLEEIEKELFTLPTTYDDLSRIDDMTLTVAQHIINAAKIEDRPDILREQATIVFKIQMTTDAFGEVKVLTPEDEWESVKEELIEYVMQKNRRGDEETELNEKQIELLLNEGMFDECIKGFPEPTDQSNCDILERLWCEVDKNDPSKLQELLPLVSKYVTREYKRYEIERSSSLLDLVDAYDHDFVVSLYKEIADTLLVSIVQKQYIPFVNFLKSVQKRLTKDGKKKEWNTFIEELKKQHKGKKKLMQIISMENL